MKFIAKFLFGFSALAFVGCSADEPVVNPETPETPDGDVAYMAISISSPESAGSRATEDGGYEASWDVEDEHNVNSVDFYFFEQDGTYAFSASASDNFQQNGTSGKDNVEYVGTKQILILNGVRTNNYPEYVITVLNKPTGFTPGQTMSETAETLTAYASKGAFVMTTSSFFGEVKIGETEELRHDNTAYYATKLSKSDFKTTLSEANTVTNPVEIYVERLDAKVQLSLGTETDKYEDVAGDGRYYKLSQTLAGGDNNTNGDNMSDVELYVKVIGWDLNATAVDSYMSKKLDTSWNTTAPQTNWSWNNTSDFRSFWAQAYTYGINGDSSDKLKYITAQKVTQSTLGTEDNNDDKANYTYCYENTNAPDNIFAAVDGGSLELNGQAAAVKNALTTHVVLHTRIYEKGSDGKMTTAGELVQYRGILYTGTSYKNLLLNRLKNSDKLNYWVLVDSNVSADDAKTDDWKTIDASYLTISRDDSEGHVLGQIKVSATLPESQTVYYYNAEEEKYVAYESAEAFKSALDSALADVVDSDNPAVGSNGNSDAFYYIPIEHHALASETNAVEGYYGVVRNHWYKLVVKSFKKVGHLVYDPDSDTTTIIPEGPEDPLYYVGANINILSWKVVNQTVTDL